jgi:putative phosphoesterase
LSERVGFISDIHGNAVGLRAVTEDLRRQEVERVVCLGDAVQGGSQPAEVAQILQELGCPVVMGNADHFILTGESAEPASPAWLEAREWTRRQLGDAGLAYMESFQPTVEIEIDGGPRILCFHGSPGSFDGVLLPETPLEEFERILGGREFDWMVGGHTHLQWSRTLGGSHFFNPGSVGIAYNRHMVEAEFYIYPIAEFAVLHVDGSHAALEFCRVPFDVDELERVSLASGKPHAERDARRYRPVA